MARVIHIAIKYLLFVLKLKLIAINAILFTVNTCALSSSTGSAVIVLSSNSNTNELNSTNVRSVALSLTQQDIHVVGGQPQLQDEEHHHNSQQQSQQETDTYYGKCCLGVTDS